MSTNTLVADDKYIPIPKTPGKPVDLYDDAGLQRGEIIYLLGSVRGKRTGHEAIVVDRWNAYIEGYGFGTTSNLVAKVLDGQIARGPEWFETHSGVVLADQRQFRRQLGLWKD